MRAMATGSKRRRRAPAWTRLSLDDLLDVRLCDLELTIEGTALETRIEELYANLRARGLRFKPHVWLSTDWFSPDGNTGFAVPFYLAHPGSPASNGVRCSRSRAAHRTGA